MNTFSIHLLGPFEIARLGLDGPLELRRQTRAVLAFLAATGQPQLRQTLADMFCQEVDDPPRALRSILSRLRQHLGATALLTVGNTIQLNLAIARIDCLDFERGLAGDLAARSLDDIAAAVDLYRGTFLENVTLDSSPAFELWALNQRTRYQRLYEHGLEALVAGLVARGEIEAAIVRNHQLVQSNPLLEEAHARLMWLYAHSGQRTAALEQYRHYSQLLRRELAVDPTPELLALRNKIAEGRQDLSRRLHAATAVPRPTPQQPGSFVGRAEEIAQLRQAWAAAHSGSLGVVLLEAEAGMGKTRLAQEFAVALPEALFLVGSCYESTRAMAYAPWLEVLETRLGHFDDATLRRLSPFAVDYLTRLLPTLTRRLRRSRPALPPISGGELRRLFMAVGEFLLDLSVPTPLLLFVDNLQWADEASLQLFHFLARRAPSGPVLLIGAWRSEDISDTPALQSLVGDLLRHPYWRLSLRPFGSQTVAGLIAQHWPSLPVGDRPRVAAMLVEATGGNPLFISEILRDLARTVEVPSILPVPKSVGELVQRRLNMLPENSRQVLEAMAVLDTPATLAQAQQTSGRSEEETIAAIDQALRRNLLQVPAESPDARYAFSHDIVREAVSGQLSHIRHQVLHRRAALALEQAGAPTATLAHHWRQGGDLEKEGHYTVLAGEQAATIYANDEAVRYLERAVQLIKPPEQRGTIMCRLGEVLQLLARHQEAEQIYQQALALAETADDRRTQARCQVALGRLMRLRGDYAQAFAWLTQAQSLYRALSDQKGMAQTLGGMGAVHWAQLDQPRALSCFQEQLEIGRRLNDRAGIGAAIGSMGVVYMEQGKYAQALDCFTQRLQIDMEIDDRLSLAKTLANMGIAYDEQGAYTHALTCYHASLRGMLELGDRQNVCVTTGNMIGIYAALKQFALAEQLSQRALAMGRMLKLPIYICEYLHVTADLLAHQQRYTEAVAFNEEAISIATQIGQTDIVFPAMLLAIRLRLANSQIVIARALEELELLLDRWSEDHKQAALFYEMWHLNQHKASFRQQATKLYGRLYAYTPKMIYRQRYEELTGASLPPPPPLPLPPGVVSGSPIDIETLLAGVDQLLLASGR